jgi:MFS transporter, YNFM family, putative membrane transport protein
VTTWEGEGHTIQGMSSNWLGLSSFGLGAAGMFATVYCTQAILPTLGREFGVGAARTGLTISVVVVAMAVGAWIWGPLSDRIGRKRCLVLSSGLLVAPTVGLGLAPSFGVLLLCRLLQGLCMPGLLAVGLNYVQEVFGDWLGGKAMGCYLSSLVAGGLIGRVGVAIASESDQGTASAIYYSCYYTGGAVAAYLPGVAWQWWGWPGVTGSALGVVALAAGIFLFAGIVREHRPKF